MAKNCYIEAGYSEQEQLELFGNVDLTDPNIHNIANEVAINLAINKRQKVMSALKKVDIVKYAEQHKAGKLSAIKALLTRDKFGNSGNVSIEQTSEAYLSYFSKKLAQMLDANRVKLTQSGKRLLGFEIDESGMKNVIKEMYTPGATGDALAESYGRAISEVFEDIRQQFNRLGGSIRKMEGTWLPQKHDAVKVRKAGKTIEESRLTWKSKIKPLLDQKRMREMVELNSKGPGDFDVKLDKALDEIFNNIVTDGAHSMDPDHVKVSGISKKLGNRHREHRFLHFKDGDAWLKYQSEFGSPNILASIQDHIHMMSLEMGAMKVLGPDPDAMIGYLKNMEMKARAEDVVQGVKKTKAQRIREAAAPSIEEVYDTLMGRTSMSNNFLAQSMTGLRNYTVGTRLGSAFLSAISDHGFATTASKINDISTMKMYWNYLKGLNPLDPQDRILATQMGIIPEYAADRAISAHRFSEVIGHNFAANLSDFTMRASALNVHTVAMKQAFGMEMYASLARDVGKSWTELSSRRKGSFKRYGITEMDWERIRKHPLKDIRGAKLMDPLTMDMEDMIKIQGMTLAEMRLAVPEPDAFDRAALNRGAKSGTMQGEFWKSMVQFKSFPTTIITNQITRMMYDAQMTVPDRLASTANLLILTTVLGSMALQLKEISKGNDMMDMDNKFWWRALAQGGGFGILGDMIFKPLDEVTMDDGWGAFGPAFPLIENMLMDLMIKPLQGAVGVYEATGDEILETLGQDAYFFFKKNLPFNNLWYARVAIERNVFDRMGQLMDPDHNRRYRRQLRKMKKERGHEKWYPMNGEIQAPEGPSKVNIPFTDTTIVENGEITF